MIPLNPARVNWPVPEPQLPEEIDRALADAALAAVTAYRRARGGFDRAQLAEVVAGGADGTPTMRVDALVEDAVVDAVGRSRVNLLSEEAGFVDNGSAVTLVVDPVDGSANAARGIPLSCFAGAVTVDGVATEAVTVWLDTGRTWWARAGEPAPFRTSGRIALDGSLIALLPPKDRSKVSWSRVADRADRVRGLGTSCLEAMLVAEGSLDAFADPGSDSHRIVDLAAALVTLPAAGGVVLDVRGRPFTFDTDLSHRWSGVVAATPDLGDELVATITG